MDSRLSPSSSPSISSADEMDPIFETEQVAPESPTEATSLQTVTRGQAPLTPGATGPNKRRAVAPSETQPSSKSTRKRTDERGGAELPGLAIRKQERVGTSKDDLVDTDIVKYLRSAIGDPFDEEAVQKASR